MLPAPYRSQKDITLFHKLSSQENTTRINAMLFFLTYAVPFRAVHFKSFRTCTDVFALKVLTAITTTAIVVCTLINV